MSNSVRESFNSVDCHDAKLLSFSLERKVSPSGESVDNLLLHLGNFHNKSRKATKAQLTFTNCAAIRMNLDLVSKQMCADDIASAICTIDSAFHKEYDAPEHLHFAIQLIPPGGNIDVLAKNYSIVET